MTDIQLFIPQKVIVFDNLLNTITINYYVITKGKIEEEYAQAVNEIKEIIETIHSGTVNEAKKSLLKSDF